MAIQSLGVGSGLALDDLVKQLIAAERKPRQDRLDKREESLDAVISGIGQLKSKMDAFKESVDALRRDNQLQSRSATTTHPGITSEEGSGPFTAEASNSAVTGSYKIAITQLAEGSRIETADAVDGGFSSKTDSVSGTAGSLTFKVGSESFDVNVTAGMTMEQLRNKINANADNFGVNASIISTGTADGGAKLVFSSDKTGAGNDLQIVNNNNIADLNRVSTTDSAETATYLTPVKSATNAQATVDGILVESETNRFENVIDNVAFSATELSTKNASDEFQTSTLNIGLDKKGTEKKVRDFVDDYNSLMSEIGTLTKYGGSELEDDGALAGDFMARGISSGLANIASGTVSTSELGSLFQIGIAFDEDGKLEISDVDEFGFGSGEDRLNEALDSNFDEFAKLFTDEKEGIASRMYDYLREYTTFDGLLRTREQSVKDEKDQLGKERERFELQMLNFEDIQRKKYLALDQTVSQLNRTGNALLTALNSTGF
ncbi:flagellar filament capping protein FliD [Lacimicrobium alkaliphilum]|uniref:Flagellar hook-associated protein 2 n=1 Tax=Lacimicrobium alkaliphilum TaxID=1526571 RepID=A0ABQ1RLY4_9ALTE|nr:flagellar filament capping protein FliD [Lacimicrobium alkaliphilum]GGD72341.1 flagellar hook-associated protein 2 [Lacimicrobium alkaliphilum]